MPHKARKIRKKRGSRTQGYGRVGQHRKGGTKGFTKAGRHKQGWSYVLRYEPDYFKKKGFKSPKSLKRDIRAINVSELEELAYKLVLEKKVPRRGKISIDLGEYGFNKLLGKGKITRPVEVKVESFSEIAAKKIEAVGGQIITD